MRSVWIRKMVLRLPGLSPRQARLAGQTVARQLSLRLAGAIADGAFHAGHPNEMNIRFSLPAGSPVEKISEAVAGKIISNCSDGNARESREG